MNKKILAENWIKLQLLSDQPEKAEEFMWAAEEFDLLTDGNPSECWEVILEVIKKTDNEWVLTNLAAGPLENFLALSPNQAIELLEVEIPKNSKLKNILSGIWKSLIPDEIWDRIQVLAS